MNDLIAKDRPLWLPLLHGMIAAWARRAGSPERLPGLAGFEDWERSVGGVLGLWGLGNRFGSNILSWRSDGDSETNDAERFLAIWYEARAKKVYWSAQDLLVLAEKQGLFPRILDRTGHGRLVAFSRSVLSALGVPRDISDGTTIRRFRVIRKGTVNSHHGFEYRLEVE
jgi:hypothetical protein